MRLLTAIFGPPQPKAAYLECWQRAEEIAIEITKCRDFLQIEICRTLIEIELLKHPDLFPPHADELNKIILAQVQQINVMSVRMRRELQQH